jgi:xanthine/uracil permease
MTGIAALGVYAIVEELPVMLVSAATIAVTVYLFRCARTRDRIIAIVAAGLGGSIAAEIVHSIYRHSAVAESTTAMNGGEMFKLAILLGLISAAAIVIVVALTEIYLKIVNPQSE